MLAKEYLRSELFSLSLSSHEQDSKEYCNNSFIIHTLIHFIQACSTNIVTVYIDLNNNKIQRFTY